ncbi:MAG TPA: hypothetical protein VFA50_22390 [Stellaceae bacterium]|nr:hypothetical protein [Stellaceae bacterium]
MAELAPELVHKPVELVLLQRGLRGQAVHRNLDDLDPESGGLVIADTGPLQDPLGCDSRGAGAMLGDQNAGEERGLSRVVVHIPPTARLGV